MSDTDLTPSTREQVWAYLLRLWAANSLSTPTGIEVYGHRHALVRLPDNERGQVDRWAAALGMKLCKADRRGWYQPARNMAENEAFPGWHFSVSCHLDIGADAAKHWSGPVVAAETDSREQLAAHLVEVSA